MNRKASESAVDRLIALALDQKSTQAEAHEEPAAAETMNTHGQTEIEAVPLFGEPAPPSAQELEHNPMWKALLQFRAVLPYISRLLEISNPTHASSALSHEVRQSVGDLQSSHRELRVVVQDQALHLQRIEDAMVRTQEATERNADELTEVSDDLKSMHALVKRATGIVAGLLVVLIALVVFLLVRVPHLLH